jgi:hypothetical protein
MHVSISNVIEYNVVGLKPIIITQFECVTLGSFSNRLIYFKKISDKHHHFKIVIF